VPQTEGGEFKTRARSVRACGNTSSGDWGPATAYSISITLAKNRVSPRRAFLLSNIWSLLLGTLPQVDAHNEGEIRYPRKNLNVANSDSHADKDPKTDRNSDADSHPDPDYTNSWEPCIPEPNLKEEPL